MSGKKPEILPPFQTILIQKLPVLHDLLRTIEVDPLAVWYELCAFDMEVPVEIKEKFSPKLQDIEEGLDKIVTKGPTTSIRNKNMFDSRSAYLNRDHKVKKLARAFFDILDSEGYMKQLKGFGDVQESNALGKKK